MGSAQSADEAAIAVPIVIALLVLICCLCLCCLCLARSEQRRRLVEQELKGQKGEKQAKEDELNVQTTSLRPGSIKVGRGSVDLGFGPRQWGQLPIDALAGLAILSPRQMTPRSAAAAAVPAPPSAPSESSWQKIDKSGPTDAKV